MVRHHSISFSHALSGFYYALTSQPNFIIHGVLSFLAVLAGYLFQISQSEWLILIFTVVLGLVIELVNTSIESVVDLVTDLYHHQAKIAKDTAAAAMLLYAFGSLVIATVIFLPKILQLWPSF